MTSIILPNGWRPRPYQLGAWGALERGVKRVCLVWHRRAGKDDLCLHWSATRMMQDIGTYWHMLPKALQARKAIWDAINPRTGMRRINEAFPHAIRDTSREHDMFIRLHGGSTWQVLGSDNFETSIGSPPRGVVFSEYAQCDPRAWEFIRPILVENGGWALFIYTPRGKNHGFRLYEMARQSPDWHAEILTVADTRAIAPDLIERELAELTMEHGSERAQATVDQEYYCSFFTAVPGAVFGQQMRTADREGRICGVPYESGCPVITAWDLGMRDATAIWFVQVVGREIHVIDYLEDTGQDIEFYANALRAKPYVYAQQSVILPHDAGRRQLGAPGGQTIKAQLKGYGFAAVGDAVLAPRTDMANVLSITRGFFKKCFFDAVKCERGLDALRSWHFEKNDEKGINSKEPVHDWSSHGSDAFTHLALGIRPTYDRGARPQVAEGTGEVQR